jgi:hypothetical protein
MVDSEPFARRAAVIGHLMEVRWLCNQLERLADSGASYDAQTVAADLTLEAARLLAEVEAWHRD